MTQDTFPKKPFYWKDLPGDEAKATRDEWMASAFLEGYDKLVTPLPGVEPSYSLKKCPIAFAEYSYLEGENEALARDAWIRVLQSEKPLPRFLRNALVRLFSQRPVHEDRELVFNFRSNHWRDSQPKDRAIADFIEQETRKGKKPSAKKVMKVFGLKSRQAIVDALKRDKERNPEFYVK